MTKLAPSPELSDHIQSWINELPTNRLGDWPNKLCKDYNALPCHYRSLFLWCLCPDGSVIRLDLDSLGGGGDSESDPLIVYATVFGGAQAHPELLEILPPLPPGTRVCEKCGGLGYIKTAADKSDSCPRCDGKILVRE